MAGYDDVCRVHGLKPFESERAELASLPGELVALTDAGDVFCAELGLRIYSQDGNVRLAIVGDAVVVLQTRGRKRRQVTTHRVLPIDDFKYGARLTTSDAKHQRFLFGLETRAGQHIVFFFGKEQNRANFVLAYTAAFEELRPGEGPAPST